MTAASPLRRLYCSGGPWEDAFGYSRAIRTGDRIIVSGCTAVVDGAVRHAGDAGGQMGVAMEHALEAITALGGTLGDVIQTRIYVVNRSDCQAVGRVHGERFAEVRPAATPRCVRRRPWSWWPDSWMRRCSSRWRPKHGSVSLAL